MIAHTFLAVWLLATWACVGALAWRAVHGLTGGAWGVALAPALQQQRRWLPIVALAGLPLLLSAAHIFPWINDAPEASRLWYLNYPALAARTMGCFAAWAFGGWLVRRAPALTLILWLFATGVFANDWIVSLVPAWRSSAMGLVAAVGQLSVAMTLATLTLCRDAGTHSTCAVRNDAAAMLMALCLGWAYLVGIDYLTAWMADLPYETVWYVPRTQTAWGWLAVAALGFHLLLPFCLLLDRRFRARPDALRAAAGSVLLGEACHLAWMVLP